MMNSTELIIGHFEGTLTPAEAQRLDELLDSSPDVRSAFERQRAIEEEMVEDAEALVPPVGLREATLAAALGGALTTTVGGGIAAWMGTKAAALLGTLALGGLVVGGIVLSSDDDPADAITPTTQIEQTQAEGLTQEPQIDQTEEPATEPAVVSNVDTPAESSPVNADGRARRNAGGGTSEIGGHSTVDNSNNGHAPGQADTSKGIELGNEPSATIDDLNTVIKQDN